MFVLIPQLFVLLVGGFIGGFFGSAVGSAGLISLPLLLVFGFPPHVAIGTSRPGAALLEVISAVRYKREGVLTSTLLRRGLLLGIAGAIGSTTGAVLIATVGDQTLRLLLALVITTTTIFLFMKKEWGMVEYPDRQKHHLFLSRI